jgi:citrate lyase subunit beta/citryl-CoA lyase
MGYTGSLCIHPRQAAEANRVYSPGDAELKLAREIVEAFDAAAKEGRGAFALHGRMIDAPVAAQARALLARRR